VGDLTAFDTVGEWQGSGRVVAGSQQENGIGTSWERHGMCESALRDLYSGITSTKSLSFCMTTFNASPINLTFLLPQSHGNS
jgi:hypothetical protein